MIHNSIGSSSTKLKIKIKALKDYLQKFLKTNTKSSWRQNENIALFIKLQTYSNISILMRCCNLINSFPNSTDPCLNSQVTCPTQRPSVKYEWFSNTIPSGLYAFSIKNGFIKVVDSSQCGKIKKLLSLENISWNQFHMWLIRLISRNF